MSEHLAKQVQSQRPILTPKGFNQPARGGMPEAAILVGVHRDQRTLPSGGGAEIPVAEGSSSGAGQGGPPHIRWPECSGSPAKALAFTEKSAERNDKDCSPRFRGRG